MKVSPTFKYWLSLLLILDIPSEMLGTNVAVSTECPQSYTPGVSALITCRINTDIVRGAPCLQNPDTVFVKYFSQSKSVTLCDTPYQGACNSGLDTKCGCISSEGSTNTYQASFQPNVTEHNGVRLECSVNCVSSELNTTFTGNCQSVSFAAETSTTTSTTTSAEATSTSTAVDSSASISTSKGDSTISLTGSGKSAGMHGMMTGSIAVMIISSLSAFF